MKVARLMNLVELEKFDRGEEIFSYGKYYGSSLNNMAEVCDSPWVSFFNPANEGSLSLVSRMFIPDSLELRVVVLFEIDGALFRRGLGEGRYEELYIPSYSLKNAVKLWQSDTFIGDSSLELGFALSRVCEKRLLLS